MNGLKKEYYESLKSFDTEEHIDLYFYRPLGFLWSCFFRKIKQSPNVITILSIFLGIGAGICFYPNNLLINIIGILLLIWANVFDSADGQLARMTKQYSQLGRILDGIAGDFWFISIYVSIILRTIRDVSFFHTQPYRIWIIAIVAGFSHIIQCSLADRFRQFHLFILKKGQNNELEDSEKICLVLKNKNLPFAKRLIFRLYYLYTIFQEKLAPGLKLLINKIKKANEKGDLKNSNWENLRQISFPLCKWENFLTFNWRSIFLFITVLIGFPWLYFPVEIILFNFILVYLIIKGQIMSMKSLKIIKI